MTQTQIDFDAPPKVDTPRFDGSDYVPERDNVARVPLSRGLFALVDAADADAVAQFKWTVKMCANGRAYASRSVQDKGRRRNCYLHRFLMNPPKGLFVDHRNGDSLDNRRSNLRLCDCSQNTCNSPRGIGASRFKGVWLHYGKWTARIQVRGKRVYVGRCDTEEEAARAYDEAARRLHGEFARLNFPTPTPNPA